MEIGQLYAVERPRALATLIRLLGDFDLAEEALQDAFATALETWPRDGVPDQPRAWLVATARHRARTNSNRARKRISSGLWN